MSQLTSHLRHFLDFNMTNRRSALLLSTRPPATAHNKKQHAVSQHAPLSSVARVRSWS